MATRRYLLAALPAAALGLWAVGARALRPRATARFDVREPDAGPLMSAKILPPPRPIDPAPQRILVVGDSMVYNLLPLLADYCLENGHTLHPAIWWGSTSMGWAGSRKVDELLQRHDPTFVIFVLGSSEVLSKVIHTIGPPAIQKLQRRIGDRKFVWIGPPNWRQDTGINDVLEQELRPKKLFFRSAELELEREDDGIHPTPAGGRVWAEHFVRWWRDDSAVPIRLSPPTQKAKVPSSTCYGAAWKTKKT